MKRILIVALGAQGKGISGSDRIFMEFAREWSKARRVEVRVSEEGREMCRRQKLAGSNLSYAITKTGVFLRFGFFVNYLALIASGVGLGLSAKLTRPKDTVLYSASEFWMDSLPCVLLKIRYPKVKWAAAWYQTAPSPFAGYSQRYHFKAFLYWFAQLPIKPLITNFADFVMVNNEGEKKYFPRQSKAGRVIVVIGAVPLDRINEWKRKSGKYKKEYDAVFQGRFHPQKGVVELIEIWKRVVERIPGAKLAMIGDGPLMGDVKLAIAKYKLRNNIKLFGYVFDGDRKYRIFAKSKLVLHPAFYDSGGMAAAEAMAFGCPAVGFDLPAYKSYYPEGMLKVKKGSLNDFSDVVVMLLEDRKKREKLGREAYKMIVDKWSWETRAESVLSAVDK